MLLKYETNRLILKVLGPDYAPDVLRFYENDRELFERYETDRQILLTVVDYCAMSIIPTWHISFKTN